MSAELFSYSNFK